MTDDYMNIEQREQVSLEALHLLEQARLGCAEGQYEPALQQANGALWRFQEVGDAVEAVKAMSLVGILQQIAGSMHRP